MKKTAPFLMLLFGCSAFAQKLPEVQTMSRRAPANIIADGKVNEWGKQFQAHNANAAVWYSVANDDEKLYFVIHAEDVDVVHKMIRGGVTITINAADNKNVKDAAVVTFPSYGPAEAPYVSLNGRPKPMQDTALFKLKVDTFMRAMNKRLVERQKFMICSGLKQLTDSLVAVYNSYDIEAKALLDDKLCYNYELAIPLKYIGLSVNGSGSFNYNIRLNGIAPKGAGVGTTVTGRLLIVDGSSRHEMDGSSRNLRMYFPNNISGQYTLAKK